jgi:hypothetical protein
VSSHDLSSSPPFFSLTLLSLSLSLFYTFFFCSPRAYSLSISCWKKKGGGINKQTSTNKPNKKKTKCRFVEFVFCIGEGSGLEPIPGFKVLGTTTRVGGPFQVP